MTKKRKHKRLGDLLDMNSLDKRLKERPFRPFRLRTENGSRFDVRNPKYAELVKSHLEINLYDENDGGLIAMVQLLDPVKIEDLVEDGSWSRSSK